MSGPVHERADGRRFAYLHGFASGPRSHKGVALAERLRRAAGVELRLPDLNRPSFAALTFTGALEAVDALDAAHGADARWCFIGSSMGGWVAARWAELHPARVERLLLLCPGFDMPGRWPAIIGAEALARWRETGFVTLPDADGRPTPVHYGLLEDALRQPRFPEVPCPTVIVHGKQDTVVPPETSRAYAAARPARVRLVEVDDDHALARSVDEIAGEAFRLFGVV